jgi:hypothetical protein
MRHPDPDRPSHTITLALQFKAWVDAGQDTETSAEIAPRLVAKEVLRRLDTEPGFTGFEMTVEYLPGHFSTVCLEWERTRYIPELEDL